MHRRISQWREQISQYFPSFPLPLYLPGFPDYGFYSSTSDQRGPPFSFADYGSLGPQAAQLLQSEHATSACTSPLQHLPSPDQYKSPGVYHLYLIHWLIWFMCFIIQSIQSQLTNKAKQRIIDGMRGGALCFAWHKLHADLNVHTLFIFDSFCSSPEQSVSSCAFVIVLIHMQWEICGLVERGMLQLEQWLRFGLFLALHK